MSTPPAANRVLIVGAGIAGLALARALGLHGIRCTVVERRRTGTADGMGLNLPGNAVRALEALGVAEVLDLGVPIGRREYRNDKDRLLFAIDERGFWDGVGVSVCLRHQHVLDALRLHDNDLSSARYDIEVLRATRDGRLAHAEVVGADEIGPFDLVVGADGVHSAVRPGVTDFTIRPSAMTATSWRFITRNPGIDCWTAWSGPAATFLLIPLEEGQVYGYAAGNRGGGPNGDPDRIGAAFERFPAMVVATTRQLIDDRVGLYHSPVAEVACDRWSNGPVIIIGDAAHATGPVWAQGAAMALEDALVLAELLSPTADWSTVGAEYEARRGPRVQHVRAATDKMSRLVGLPGPIRNLAGPLLGPRGPGGLRAAARNSLTGHEVDITSVQDRHDPVGFDATTVSVITCWNSSGCSNSGRCPEVGNSIHCLIGAWSDANHWPARSARPFGS